MSLELRRRGLPTEYAVCAESSMARIRPDRPYSGTPAREFGVRLAANEYESTQLVVAPIDADLEGVSVAASALKGRGSASIGAEEVVVRRVAAVRVEEPSARSGADPGLYPDPLPANAPVDVGPDATAAWLITVHAPPGQAAGEYVGEVTVSPRNAPRVRLPLRATVWGFELPTASALRTCFRMIPGYLWKHYNLPPAEGVPVGWEYGVWTGADIEGRPDYFGRGVFRNGFDTVRPHMGKRGLYIEGEVCEPGTDEAPRACYHRLVPVKPDTDYVLTLWYRTEGPGDNLAAVHVHTHGVSRALPAASEWTEVRLPFNSGEKEEARVYLGLYGVGKVCYDDVSLAPAGEPGANLIDDPGFEAGGAFEDRARLLRAYRLDSLAHRCSDMDIAAPKIEVQADGQVAIDWTDFDQEIAFYVAHGLNAFNVSWARVPGGWGHVDAIDPRALAA